MYTPSNTPNGYFEEDLGRGTGRPQWKRINVLRVAEAIREAVQLGHIADGAAAYDAIVRAGIEGRPNGVKTRNPIRFE